MRQQNSLLSTVILAIIMLTAKAFTITSRPAIARLSRLNMSTEATSIVEQCKLKIQKALETDNVTVTGAFDDPNGSHIAIQVVSNLFEGKRPVQRQQLVYKALWEELQGPVHAVDSMTCKTPSEV
ncbi:BolA-like protein 1 [Mayamaea pseudoterrestris]|nr:BolA-like protein 1 [Mayamaea pseudoterrestris]